jgi:hypothetical protein
MTIYSKYLLALERLLVAGPSSGDWQSRCAAALDGEPSRELQRAISLKKRRQAGVFFTGAVLARKAVLMRRPRASGDHAYFDPACGVGDLLLAAARCLPIRPSLRETVELWGSKLLGCDIYPEFVRATKVRLLLLAQQRGAKKGSSEIDLEATFPLIGVGDGLVEYRKYQVADWVLLNPPYVSVPAPVECKWGNGKVSSAALFLERAALVCKPKQE